MTRSAPSCLLCCLLLPGATPAQGTRDTTAYRRLKAHLDAVPAIDTHDHLWPFDRLPGYVETEHGKGMNLCGLWQASYYRWTNPLTAWKPGGKFDGWWAKAKHDFADACAFYGLANPAARCGRRTPPRPWRAAAGSARCGP